jgi:phage-related protein (TIGR01555 family)
MARRSRKTFPVNDAVAPAKALPPVVSASNKVAKVSRFLDGLRNEATGIGTARSKLIYGEYTPEPLLDWVTLEALFKDNDLARKIVMKPVDDALRAGFGLQRRNSSPEKDKDDADKLIKAYKKLMHDRLGGDKLKRAAIAARLHGGGGLILGARGAGGWSRQLEDGEVTKIEYFSDWDRRTMTATTWYPDGSPATFRYQPCGSKRNVKEIVVHESRLLFFPGAMTTNDARTRNEDWDHSVLQAVFQTLKSFDQMFAATDAMFADASQAVFKLQGLIKSLAEADGQAAEDAQTRLAIMDMLRSSTKAIVLEAGSDEGDPEESYEVVERQTLGTLDKVIQQYYIRLAAAANMPLTVLLGMAPSGMDATGEMDLIFYFNTVDVYRQEALGPQILRIIKMLAKTELGEKGSEDENEWEIVWPELARPKPLDVATAENMAITSLVSLIQSQVATPEEGALSLRNIAPNLRLNIAAEPREKALKESYKEIENREMTPPTKPEEPKVVGGRPAAKQSERKTPSKAAKRQV